MQLKLGLTRPHRLKLSSSAQLLSLSPPSSSHFSSFAPCPIQIPTLYSHLLPVLLQPLSLLLISWLHIRLPSHLFCCFLCLVSPYLESLASQPLILLLQLRSTISTAAPIPPTPPPTRLAAQGAAPPPEHSCCSHPSHLSSSSSSSSSSEYPSSSCIPLCTRLPPSPFH